MCGTSSNSHGFSECSPPASKLAVQDGAIRLYTSLPQPLSGTRDVCYYIEIKVKSDQSKPGSWGGTRKLVEAEAIADCVRATIPISPRRLSVSVSQIVTQRGLSEGRPNVSQSPITGLSQPVSILVIRLAGSSSTQ